MFAMNPDNGLLDILAAAAAATEPAAAAAMETAPSATASGTATERTATMSSSASSTSHHHENPGGALDSLLDNGGTAIESTRRRRHNSGRGKDKQRNRDKDEDKRRHRRSSKTRDRDRDRDRDSHRDRKKRRRLGPYPNIPDNIQLQGEHHNRDKNNRSANGGGMRPEYEFFEKVANSLTSSVSKFSPVPNGAVDKWGAQVDGCERQRLICGASQQYQKPNSGFDRSQDDAVGSKGTLIGDDIQTYLSKVKSDETQKKEGGKSTSLKCKREEKSYLAFSNHTAVDGNTGKDEGMAVAGKRHEDEVVVLDAVSPTSHLSNEVMMSTTVTGKPSAVDDADTTPLSIGAYVDRSQEPDTLPNIHITTPNRCPSFVVKLYAVLSFHPDLSNVITWLPHGRSWTILDPVEFEVNVIPKHFGSGVSLISFTKRITNTWGFERLSMDTTANNSHGVSNEDAAVSSFASGSAKKNPNNHLLRKSYYHEYFMRGKPHLMKKMAPIADKKKKPVIITTSTAITETDLETIDRKRPLPANNEHADYQDESVIVMKMIDEFIMEHGPTTRLPVSLCHRRSLGRGRAKKKEHNRSGSGDANEDLVVQNRTASANCGKSANRSNKEGKEDKGKAGKRSPSADSGTGDRPLKLSNTVTTSVEASGQANATDAEASSSAAATGHNPTQVRATQTLAEGLQALASNPAIICSLFLNQNSLNFSNIAAALNNPPSNVANTAVAKPASGCVNSDSTVESNVTAPASCPNLLPSMMKNSGTVKFQPPQMSSDSSLIPGYQKQLTQNGYNIAPGNQVPHCPPTMYAGVRPINGNGCGGNTKTMVNNSASAPNQAPYLQVQHNQLQQSIGNTTLTNSFQNQQINSSGIANNPPMQTQAVPPAATLSNCGNVTVSDFPQLQLMLFPGSTVPKNVTNNQFPQQNGVRNTVDMASLLQKLQESQSVLSNNSSQGSNSGNASAFSHAVSNASGHSQIHQGGVSINHQGIQQNHSMNPTDMMNLLQQIQSSIQNLQNSESNHAGSQNNISPSSPPTLLPSKNDCHQENQPNSDQKDGTEDTLRNMINRAFLAGIMLGSKSVSNNSGKLRSSSDSSWTTASSLSFNQHGG